MTNPAQVELRSGRVYATGYHSLPTPSRGPFASLGKCNAPAQRSVGRTMRCGIVTPVASRNRPYRGKCHECQAKCQCQHPQPTQTKKEWSSRPRPPFHADSPNGHLPKPAPMRLHSPWAVASYGCDIGACWLVNRHIPGFLVPAG